MQDVKTLLRRSELFAGLPDAKLDQIASIGHTRTFEKGDVVIAEGDPSNELYIIEKGMVEVLIPDQPISDVHGTTGLAVVQLGRGQVFGEMALVDQGARSATIRCVEEETTLFIIPRDAFWALCEEDHHIGYVVMRNIARDLSFKLRLRNLPQTVRR